MVKPPETLNTCPVIKLASSLKKKAIEDAKSSG
jgi:hypothetical protein